MLAQPDGRMLSLLSVGIGAVVYTEKDIREMTREAIDELIKDNIKYAIKRLVEQHVATPTGEQWFRNMVDHEINKSAERIKRIENQYH